VTFLSTDVEDSARLWESDPAAMAEAVKAHDAIVRLTIERHGGHVFATRGNGFRGDGCSQVPAGAAR
jgi:class 3 adenylate cyclase